MCFGTGMLIFFTENKDAYTFDDLVDSHTALEKRVKKLEKEQAGMGKYQSEQKHSHIQKHEALHGKGI